MTLNFTFSSFFRRLVQIYCIHELNIEKNHNVDHNNESKFCIIITAKIDQRNESQFCIFTTKLLKEMKANFALLQQSKLKKVMKAKNWNFQVPFFFLYIFHKSAVTLKQQHSKLLFYLGQSANFAFLPFRKIAKFNSIVIINTIASII